MRSKTPFLLFAAAVSCSTGYIDAASHLRGRGLEAASAAVRQSDAVPESAAGASTSFGMTEEYEGIFALLNQDFKNCRRKEISGRRPMIVCGNMHVHVHVHQHPHNQNSNNSDIVLGNHSQKVFDLLSEHFPECHTGYRKSVGQSPKIICGNVHVRVHSHKHRRHPRSSKTHRRQGEDIRASELEGDVVGSSERQ